MMQRQLLLVLCAVASLTTAVVAATAEGSDGSAESCDESDLKRDAMALLTAHFDVELGAVAPGNAQHVGFQHLKTADALFAAQAIAHDDFDRAAEQFRHVLRYQRGDGQLPHIVYGGSIAASVEWFASNQTFYPGPAFWTQPNRSTTASTLVTSNVLAPPIAADVAWQIFQLSPYETVLGVVGYRPNAVAFLCDAYAPLKQLQELLLATRAAPNDSTLLLAAHHPWETFSPLSPHWISALHDLKTAADYTRVTARIPSHAKTRFAAGARAFYTADVAVDDLYEPMVYLAACITKSIQDDKAVPTTTPCGFQVFDTEFNALALRSAHALVRIARVLLDHATVCDAFEPTRDELLVDISALRAVETRLRGAILGTDASNASGLWNATTKFFDDAATWSSTAVHSLRGVMPAYATANLPPVVATGLLDHFFAPAETFHFFCSRFPLPLFTCAPELGRRETTLPLYNYFAQRAFMNNDFPGIAEYVRNKTRDMVCAATNQASSSASRSATALLALAYGSHDAAAIADFDDGFAGVTLAAAALLNILLPAVATPPNPDAPPVDHRMLTLIMCIELVVAFVVALGCFLFSVYFVIKRPRNVPTGSVGAGAAGPRNRLGRLPSGRKPAGGSATVAATVSVPTVTGQQQLPRESDVRSSFDDRSLYSEYSDDLDEPLLSDDEDVAYGSFEPAERAQQQTQQRDGDGSATSWRALKDALAAISPW